MIHVFRPILKTSLSTLLHAPSMIAFGIVIALFGMLRQPFMTAAWPSFIMRIITWQWITQMDETNLFPAPTTLTWKTILPDLLNLARTDPWGFVGLALVFFSILALLLLLLYLLFRSVAALIHTGRLFQERERYTFGRAWKGGKRVWLVVGFFFLLAQIIPWAMQGIPDPTGTTLSMLFVFLLTMLAIYSSIYCIIGGYALRAAFAAGFTCLKTRFWTTIECTVLLLGTDIIGLTLLSIIGAIAVVPILLILVIFWTLQWATLFSLLASSLYVLLILYTFFSIGAIIAFDYLVWINLFYTYEVITETSFATRSFHALRAWMKKRS